MTGPATSSIAMGSAVTEIKNVLKVGVGAVGSFTTPTGQIVTLQNGIITNIFSAQHPLAASAVFNPAYLANITNQINGIADDINALDPCALIQEVINEVMAQVQAEIEAIEAQITALNLLITIPTNLGEVIAWISRFIGPSVAAALAYIQQLEQMVVAIAALVAAAEAAASRIQNCQIAIPTPVISVPLPTATVVVT